MQLTPHDIARMMDLSAVKTFTDLETVAHLAEEAAAGESPVQRKCSPSRKEWLFNVTNARTHCWSSRHPKTTRF